MRTAAELVSHYGYAGIFSLLALGIFGLPVPDETLMAFVGYLVFRGRLHALPAFLSAFCGTMCGITLSYAMGRGFGMYVIPRWRTSLHLSVERQELVQSWFSRVGRWVLVFGYYVPGVRHVTAYVAGTSGLRFPAFSAFAYSGAFIWCLTFIGFGYFFGERWARGALGVRWSVDLLLGAVLVGILVYFWVHREKIRSAG
jgi:membrane protein DedA with SNARE-associated domain